MHGLRKSQNLADRERNVSWVSLKIVFAGEPVFRAEDVVDVRIHLARVELAARPFDERVVRLFSSFRIRRIRRGNDVLPAWGFGLHDGESDGIDLGTGDAGRRAAYTASVVRIGKGCKRVCIPSAVSQALQCRYAVESAAERVTDALALIRAEEENLILLDGPANCRSKDV